MNCYCNTFLPTSVRLQNWGGESDSGGCGDTMGCTTILSIVNTNVTMLCEYLPQEFPLWQTIKYYIFNSAKNIQICSDVLLL